MIYYFLLLNKHKNLSLKRKSDYKRNLIITAMLMVFSVMYLILLFVAVPKGDFETLSVFLVPAIIILDFSLRFFLKKNADAAIVPYLTLPIPRKTLILYIILSDLPRFWIWGCGLIYCLILCYCGVLTVLTTITLLFFILLNNYLIAFLKALMGGYALVVYPVCLGFIMVIMLVVNSLSQIFAITILTFAVLSLVIALFFTLKENLYKELNRIAL
ncbi:hypothetical protein FACS189426_08290 [Bacteroidia bacterium]|nr:hypothetical protein FACS189426_08290 [Bacteroidia bacterium]GHV71056.1 hypothetical protein FACS189420_4680 [Bacteroidia bacterium]